MYYVSAILVCNKFITITQCSNIIQLTSQHISRYSDTLNIPIHYRLDTDGVVTISNKTCDVVHVSSSDIRALLSVVVDIHPGHVVSDPVLVALHWSVGPGEGNAGIEGGDVVYIRGWLWFCNG